MAGLALAVAAFWGWGWALMRWLAADTKDAVVRNSMPVASGMVVAMVLLQVLGALGVLNAWGVWGLLLGGWLLAVRGGLARAQCAVPAQRDATGPWRTLALTLVVAAVLATTAKAVFPVWVGDGIMYHLPHAAAWADAQRLTINDNLRYPWFPYNYDLLYSAALVVWDGVMTHLLHSLSGWLVVVLIWRFGRQMWATPVALVAALAWLQLSTWYYRTAYIELGLTLLLMASLMALYLWWQSRYRSTGWLVLAWAFMGAAAGTKYQALVYAPFLAVVTLMCCRDWKTWTVAAAGFLVPCLYWYARNWLHTGNPFDPLAGNVFGWFDWNAEDMAYQMMDIKEFARNWPPKPLAVAALALVLPSFWRHPVLRTCNLFALFSFVVWYVTSHYDRYLMPVYPVLLLLACGAVWQLLKDLLALCGRAGAGAQLVRAAPGWLALKPVQVVPWVLIAVVLTGAVVQLPKRLKHLPQTEEAQLAYVRDRVEYAGIMQKMAKYAPAKAYQFGMEGAVYLLPLKSHGDHFGRWRYRDYQDLPALDLARKLRAQGIEYLLVRNYSLATMEAKPGFAACFQPIEEDKGHRAYRICNP